MEETTAAQPGKSFYKQSEVNMIYAGLRRVSFSYITSLTNGRETQQHTNCSETKIGTSAVLMCKEDSTLTDGNTGDINTQDGLQNDEKQKFFIWHVNNNVSAPFIIIDLKENVVLCSIELYFLSLPKSSINTPKLKLYWSSDNSINPQHILPFQRMAYLIGSGKYKYRAILNNTNIIPYIYVQMRQMQHLKGDSWIYLSEMKVFTNGTKGEIVVKSETLCFFFIVFLKFPLYISVCMNNRDSLS